MRNLNLGICFTRNECLDLFKLYTQLLDDKS